MVGFSDNDFIVARGKATQYIGRYKIGLLDLSPSNIDKVDKFLTKVYKDWRAGKLEDLVAYEIGCILEGEPIHHLMTVSVYPLCDIAHFLDSGEINKIKKK